MFNDGTSLLRGSTAIGLVAYALVSVIWTGQVVGERLIAKSDWGAQCRASIEREAARAASTPEPEIPDAVKCTALVEWIRPDLAEVCRKHGDPTWKIPFSEELRKIQHAKRQFEADRMSAAVDGAPNRCDCAVAVVLEEDRIAYGLHAGTARLVTPHKVSAREARLTTALHSPHCAHRS